jgi:NADPH-dependent curcumin reductase CurA
MTTAQRVVLARRPEGMPVADDFRIDEVADEPLADGVVRVEVDTLSIDAFIRTVLESKAYHGSVPVGGMVTAMGVGRVVESSFEPLAVGDAVFGPLCAQSRATLPGFMLEKIDPERAPITSWLGVLGLTTGLTAWFGIREVGAVREGETVVVSGAAGAVGSMAVQLARVAGARVIGIAGGAAKVGYLEDELGATAGIDYKNEDVDARLRELAPDGIDVYFDNVGGPLLDVVLDQIAERARIVICGAISQYDDMDDVRGPKLYLRLAERHARMEGFAVTHFQDRFAEAEADLAALLAKGELKLPEHVVEGLASFPDALKTLFDGGHIGKLLLRP